jgi:hypothetical protein
VLSCPAGGPENAARPLPDRNKREAAELLAAMSAGRQSPPPISRVGVHCAPLKHRCLAGRAENRLSFPGFPWASASSICFQATITGARCDGVRSGQWETALRVDNGLSSFANSERPIGIKSATWRLGRSLTRLIWRDAGAQKTPFGAAHAGQRPPLLGPEAPGDLWPARRARPPARRWRSEIRLVNLVGLQ